MKLPEVDNSQVREIGRSVVTAWLEHRSVTTLKHGDAADLMERVGAAIEAEQVVRADLLATVRAEERKAVWSEVLDIANKHLDEPGFGYLLRNKLLEAAAENRKGER